MPTSSSSVDAAASVGGAESEQPAEIGHQLFGGEVVVEVGLLRQIAEPALRRRIAQGAAEKLRASGCGKDQLQQKLERGRFAGPVGTEKAEDLAALDLQRETIECAARPLAPEPDLVILGELDRLNRDDTAKGNATTTPEGHEKDHRLVLRSASVSIAIQRQGFADVRCSS